MLSVFNFWSSPGGLTSLFSIEIQWNGLLRAKWVVILDTGHYLTSHPTDIKSSYEKQILLDDEMCMYALMWDLKTMNISMLYILYYTSDVSVDPMKKSELSKRKNNV